MGSKLASSRKRSSSEGGMDSPGEKRAKLQRSLAELDALISGLEHEEDEQEVVGGDGAGAEAQPKAEAERPARRRACDVKVIIGTSELARDLAMVERIMTMVNGAYYEANKELLHPSQTSYQRLSRSEVIDRLEMGDAGARANRVLHIAYLGDALTPDSVVGCMSSTFQPPWTERGCGHWGLLVVEVDRQGQGIAGALVAAAEERLAGACHEIQIEYEYTPGHAYSERLMSWYEGRCGFVCAAGYPRREGTQFRKCRKPIPPQLARLGRIARLKAIRAEVAEELEAVEKVAAGGTPVTSFGASPSGDDEEEAESSSCGTASPS